MWRFLRAVRSVYRHLHGTKLSPCFLVVLDHEAHKDVVARVGDAMADIGGRHVMYRVWIVPAERSAVVSALTKARERDDACLVIDVAAVAYHRRLHPDSQDLMDYLEA